MADASSEHATRLFRGRAANGLDVLRRRRLPLHRHLHEGGDPTASPETTRLQSFAWVAACAEMTDRVGRSWSRTGDLDFNREQRASGRLVAWALLASVFVLAAAAAAKEPPVPPGKGTVGKVTVALLGPGIDYGLPELKGRLARDGEGDLISWDFTDSDTKPFTEGGIGTDAARELAAQTDATVVIAKEQPGDPQAFGHMMSFTAKTPARIVVWLTADPLRADWPIFQQAVNHFKEHLFLIANLTKDPHPSIAEVSKLANVHVVDFSSDLRGSDPSSIGSFLGSIAKSAVAIAATRPSSTAAELKEALARSAKP